MAIPAANVAYVGNGPSKTGMVVADRVSAGNQARQLIGTVTFTGDGALTTATVNYIDGTEVLGFAPSAVLASRSGGTAAASVSVVSVVDAGDNGKTAAINFSAAPGNGLTVIASLLIQK